MQEKTIIDHWIEAKKICREYKERGSAQFPTGLRFIDDITGGIRKGEIWIIAGKSGSGKTSLALQIAASCADRSDNSIMFLSLEMKGWEMVLRMFSKMYNIEYSDLINGKQDISEGQADSFEKYLSRIDFEVVEFGYRYDEIEKAIKEMYSNKKPDIIFIDYVQLIDRKGFGDDRIAIEEYLRGLKELSKKLNIAFVVISQFRRMPSGADYNRPPDMQDLKGSGSLEQTADKVLLLYGKYENDRLKYFLKIAKNRQGRKLTQELIFHGATYRFEEVREDGY